SGHGGPAGTLGPRRRRRSRGAPCSRSADRRARPRHGPGGRAPPLRHHPRLDRVSWPQRYDPLGSPLWSTTVAALPIVVLLGSLAWLRLRAPWAALAGLVASILV